MNYHERELFKIMRNDFRPVSSVCLSSFSLSLLSLFFEMNNRRPVSFPTSTIMIIFPSTHAANGNKC